LTEGRTTTPDATGVRVAIVDRHLETATMPLQYRYLMILTSVT
jgi:hypothetical protein